MSNSETLLQAWLDAKAAETEAANARLAIEGEILQAFKARPEGQVTHKAGDYSLTLNQPISIKLDIDTWQQIASVCPESLRPVKVKLEADGVGIKYLQNNEPDIWKTIARAFETKPGKVSVKVVKNGSQ
jgi:hypothetical protein